MKVKKFLVLCSLANFSFALASTAFAGDPGAGDGSVTCRWKCMRQDEYGVCVEWEQVCTSGGFFVKADILKSIPQNTDSFESKTSADGRIELTRISFVK